MQINGVDWCLAQGCHLNGTGGAASPREFVGKMYHVSVLSNTAVDDIRTHFKVVTLEKQTYLCTSLDG